MADLFLRFFAALLLLVTLASALQVTPNSPCSTLCLDDSRFNPADASLSSTKGTDIECTDSKYSEAKGQKFQNCQECLQSSSFGTDEENDQGWFIYNLRFASDWCLYASDNAAKPSGPCMDAVTCGILERSVNVTKEELKGGSVFDYCSINGTSFDADAVTCNSCLQHMPDYKYLSNWIIALQAGCTQRPSQKALIGLDGSVFESRVINATSPQAPGSEQPKKSSGGLPQGAMIGIIVAVVVAVLIIAYIVAWQCYKRRKTGPSRGLHPRFGATNITPPVEGSYSEYKPEPVMEVLPWDKENFVLKDIRSETSMSGRSNVSSDSFDIDRAPSPEPMNLAPAPPRSESQASGPPINPLRMNSYTKPRAATPPTTLQIPADRTSDSPRAASTAPTSAVQTTKPDSITSGTPQPLTAQNLTAYDSNSTRSSSATPQQATTKRMTTHDPSSHIDAAPRPGYAASVISTTSTTFSPGVYPPPTPYTSESRPLSTVSVSTSRNNFPMAPLPAYNPADYAPKPKPAQPTNYSRATNYTPKPTNPYHTAAHTQSQQQQLQQRFAGPPSQGQQQKRRPPNLIFHKPTPSQASARYTPFPPTTQPQTLSQTQASQPAHRPTASQSSAKYLESSVPKQSEGSVPIIAIPIPAPKRQTVDMRSFIGLGVNTHVKPAPDPLPSSVPVSAVSASKSQAQQIPRQQSPPTRQLTPEEELPSGLDRTNSLIRQSGSAFRELAEGLGIRHMTARPDDLHRDLDLEAGGESAGAAARSSSLARSISRASYRGRSASRPRRDSMKERSRERGRRDRERSGSRQGTRTESKLGFRFEFRGQDKVTEGSPQSGSTQQSIEQWPGTGVIREPKKA